MRYAIWNNKGGVGKSFLSFILGTELAKRNSDGHVILVDMCPQANLSEVVLGGNGEGSSRLTALLKKDDRLTVGGYFDERIASPHKMTGRESKYLLSASKYNGNTPGNLWLISGDPSLEIQAQVISQIGGQTLPQDTWKNVHNWLLDLVNVCEQHLGIKNTTVLIDCNPSFSAYTELSMMAAQRLIVPCSSDGSSARAIINIGALLYGVGPATYEGVSFKSKADKFGMPIPVVHTVLLNRSTQYNRKASRAFTAMFNEIKARVRGLRKDHPEHFASGSEIFQEVPDTHSVAIVCSHLGLPLYDVRTRRYNVQGTRTQVNNEPLNRYKDAIEKLIGSICP